LLAADLVGRAQLVLAQGGDLGDEGLVLGGRLPVPLGLAGVTHQFVDGGDGDVALLVSEHHGAQHHLFGQLVGLGFHHQHGAFGAGHHQVELGIGQVTLARVEHVLAVDIAHARRADRAVERNTRHGQGRAGADHGGDVSLHLGVEAQHVHHHLHFVEEAVREEGADRAVDQATGERLEFAWAAFALEEAARDATGGVGLLDVVDGQGEEVLARLGFALGHHRGQHDGAFNVDEDRAAGLAGDFTRFEGDGVGAPLEGLGNFVEQAHAVGSPMKAGSSDS